MALVLVWTLGTLGHYWEALKTALRRAVRSRIFVAIERGDAQRVYQLATPRRLRSARNEFGARPLATAISQTQTAIACGLAERGGLIPGDGALASAILSADFQVIAKLIAIGANLEEPLRKDPALRDWTPLMWATHRCNFAAMRLLLDAGANVNAQTSDGTTAVMCTSEGKDDDLVALELLCQYKPVLTHKDWRGRTILDEARDRARFSGRTAMQDLLRTRYPEAFFGET